MNDLKDSIFYTKLVKLNNALHQYKAVERPYKKSFDLINWYIESTIKNYMIFSSKKDNESDNKETFKKYRQHVYWINLGANIGSEFGGYHYAVVIKEFSTTAVIVPLTSQKEITPGWLRGDDTIVDIGDVVGRNGKKVAAYACVSRILSVSKKRLDRLGNKKDGYYDLELTNEQMNLVDKKILETFIYDCNMD